MAKKPAAPELDEVTPVAEVPAAEVAVPKSVTVDVLLRRDLDCGLKAGDKLARVTLEPGVNLNFLACAIENAMAGPAE